MEESLFSLLKAYKLQIKGQNCEAIEIYNTQLSKYCDNEILLFRAIAYAEDGNLDKAELDLNKILETDSNNVEAKTRLAVIHFRKGQFEEAKALCESTLPLLNSNSNLFTKLNLTLSKAKAEISCSRLPSSNGINSEIKKINEIEEKSSKNIFNTSGKVSYTWYQTDNKIGIEFPVALSNPSQFVHKIEAKSANFEIKLSDSTTQEFHFEFFAEVRNEKAIINYSLSKVEVIIEKTQTNNPWPHLESTSNNSNPIEFSKPVYPSSSKTQKDWSKIDKECDELLKDEGGDPAMKLFQQIYANSDEDTRRAMIKSMQESDGTALYY